MESDPLGKVDFGGALFSEKTDELIETWYTAARTKVYFKDKTFGDDNHWIEKQFPGKEMRIVSRSRDENLWLVTMESDTEPGQTLLFDRKARKLTPAIHGCEKLPRADLAEMKPHLLQIVGWAGDPGIPHPAEGGPAQKSAHDRISARRTVGTR